MNERKHIEVVAAIILQSKSAVKKQVPNNSSN